MSTHIVAVAEGSMSGTRSSNGCVAFLGIPFAEPPIGSLRFRPPVAKKPWAGVFEADRFGSVPVQAFMGPPEALKDFYDVPPSGSLRVLGAEDCLTLNVWVPALDGGTRPVYVWIHGGANHLEGSRLPIYHGDELAKAGDIVVVSLNYRLGVFGFMDVEPVLGPEYRGAYVNGLRDQFMALEWVKANIRAFGGDPDNITVGGESAGGIDTSWHLSSGRLKGLARRAVIMSNVIGPAGIGGDNGRYRHSAETIRTLHSSFMTKAGIADARYLLAADAYSIYERILDTYPFDGILFGLDVIFYPGIDGDFIKDEPLQSVSTGAMTGIDLLAGYTNYEVGLWLTWEPDLGNLGLAWMAERLDCLAPETQSLAAEFYASNYVLEPLQAQAHHLISDCVFTVPTTLFSEAAQRAGSKVWMYRFDLEVDDKRRAMHAADLPFFFNRPLSAAADELIGPAVDDAARSTRLRLAKEMAGALISFIRTGKPQTAELPDWPEYDRAKGQAMIFGAEARVAAHPLGARKTFWEETLIKGLAGGQGIGHST